MHNAIITIPKSKSTNDTATDIFPGSKLFTKACSIIAKLYHNLSTTSPNPSPVRQSRLISQLTRLPAPASPMHRTVSPTPHAPHGGSATPTQERREGREGLNPMSRARTRTSQSKRPTKKSIKKKKEKKHLRLARAPGDCAAGNSINLPGQGRGGDSRVEQGQQNHAHRRPAPSRAVAL